MINILIVDDEPDLLNILECAISQKGYNVYKSNNGINALKVLKDNKNIDLVITDIQMPKMNGLVLINEIKTKINKNMPIIIISGEIGRSKVKHVLDLNIDAYIPKPFSVRELIVLIEDVLNGKKKPFSKTLATINDKEFLRIDINELIETPVSDYDLFIKFTSTKYLKILKKGNEFGIDRSIAYKKSSLNNLYVKMQDHKKYLNKSIEWYKKYKNSDMNKIERAKEVRKLNEIVLDEIYSENIDREIFEATVEVSKENVDLALRNVELLDLLRELEKYSNDIYRHVAAVNIFSAMLSNKIEWVSKSIMLKLTIASFYHDIGKKWVDKMILDKPYSEYDDKDWIEYKKHPEYGTDILSEIPTVSQDILEVVLQHHESFNGDGYPNRKCYTHIHPLARLLTIANDYCNLTVKNAKNPVLKHKNAIKMMKTNIERYDDMMFNTFLKLFY